MDDQRWISLILGFTQLRRERRRHNEDYITNRTAY
jgi:hypothetical protein